VGLTHGATNRQSTAGGAGRKRVQMAKGLIREVFEAGLRVLCARYLPESQAAATDSPAPSTDHLRVVAPEDEERTTRPAQGPVQPSATAPLPEEYTGPLLTDAGDLATAMHATYFHHFGMGGHVTGSSGHCPAGSGRSAAG
jgi:hypothetical protein